MDKETQQFKQKYDEENGTCAGCGCIINKDGPNWCVECAPECY